MALNAIFLFLKRMSYWNASLHNTDLIKTCGHATVSVCINISYWNWPALSNEIVCLTRIVVPNKLPLFTLHKEHSLYTKVFLFVKSVLTVRKIFLHQHRLSLW